MQARAAQAAPDPLNPTAASLLGFLHEGPLSGWDLVVKAEGTIGDFWNISKSQVYRELESLLGAGCVAIGKEGARSRRPYAITAKGRAAFAAWLREEPAPLNMRWPLALTEFFGSHLDDEMLLRFRNAHRARHAATVSELESISPETIQDPHVAAVLDLGIRFHALVVAWIDERGSSLKKKPKSRSKSESSPRRRAAKA